MRRRRTAATYRPSRLPTCRPILYSAQSTVKECKVVHAAVDRGVDYFDVFWAQPAFRDSMGAAFRGHRDRVLLAAHLGATEMNGQGDRTRDPALALKFFHDFLTRYHTDYADVLHVHNVDEQEDNSGPWGRAACWKSPSG